MASGRFLTAAWLDLVMLNFEIDPVVLAPLVPPGCELDSWQSRHFVSIVGFWFRQTRLLGVPIPWHRDFRDQSALYVRRRAGGETRRGVVFIKEIVQRRAVVAVARWIYNENYVYCPTGSRVVRPCDAVPAGTFAYRWQSAAGWNEVAAEVHGLPAAPGADSEEAFITEHYWGYARQRDGGTVEYEVRHPPWHVWRATQSRLQLDARGVYGDGFAAALSRKPTSAFVADGSDVVVMRGRRLR